MVFFNRSPEGDGGTGKISGIAMGVFVLRIIFAALDMRKYLVRK